jgi:dihydroorotate dehydrogenase (fumarate)
MPELTTKWLGLELRTPIILGASPLTHDAEAVAKAVDAGAGAVVMYSLFEEQVVAEQMAAHHFMDARTDVDAEARTFLPDVDVFAMGAEPYLRQLEKIRNRVKVPVVASLNGTTPGGWTEYARACEARGAHAIELNLYDVITAAGESAAEVEARQLAVVESVVESVGVPVTVKISPFYTSVPSFVERIQTAGAMGVTLFNRFYQPDVDLENLGVDRRLMLSTPAELPLRLHALAILAPVTRLDMACTGGVHTGFDAAKALLCGADVVQVTSALLQRGPAHIGMMIAELTAWLGEKGYVSSDESRGVLALDSMPDAHVWARLNYIRVLDGWSAR